MFWRFFTGQANFVMLNIAAPLAPLALIMVFWQTTSFWVSIMAWCFLREPIYRLEIIAMVVCFSAVVVIAMQARNSDADSSDETILTDDNST